MNPAMAMWLNWGLTAIMGGFSAYQAAGGHFDATTATAVVGGAISALNGVLHMTSPSKPGPMGS